MPPIPLDDAARNLLHDVLASQAAEAHVQTRRADMSEFKHQVRDHAELLDGLVAGLGAGLGGTLELAPAEVDTVAAILRRELADLRVEIRHTATWSYKEQLRDRASVLRRVLAEVTTV